MQKENIMGTAKIPNLIMRMSLPMMLSMLVQALYNVVDSIFVARYSADALTAVSLAFPLQNLIIAFAVGTGVGVNSVLARRLGERRSEDADKAASTGIFLALVTYVVFALAGLALSKPFLAMFTSDAMLLDLSTQYAMICMCFSLGCFVDIMGERILQATGDSFHPMIIQGAGAITNIILDPIFIFTFDMGVAGAAIATVIGQWVSMFLAIYWVRKNSYVHVRMRRLKPSARLIRDIYAVGAPTIVMNSVSTVLVSALNGILIRFSNMAVSVFGVYYKLQSFVFMPVFGLNNGLIPILAFNYGAMSRKRMTDAMKYGIVIAVAIMLVGTLIFQLCPSLLLSFFNADESMYEIGIPALRILSICFVPAAFSIVMSAAFQATGYGIFSMLVSVIRQLLVLCPCAYLLGYLVGLSGVWLSFTVAEVFGLASASVFFLYVYRKKIVPLSQGVQEYSES